MKESKIKIAGYNVDVDMLNEKDKEMLTPEIFSASYARISRSRETIDQIRSKANDDLKKTRKTNQKIVFEMGHNSVAEHAVLNIDVSNVSRKLIEELESFRLASYTERSQRYVNMEDDEMDNCCIPGEIKDADTKNKFWHMAGMQFDFYRKASNRIYNYYTYGKISDENNEKKNKSNYKKSIEDARYSLPLAAYGQLGITFNARNLEYLFRKLGASKNIEVRDFSEKLYKETEKIIPSLLKHCKPKLTNTISVNKLTDLLKVDCMLENKINSASDLNEIHVFDNFDFDKSKGDAEVRLIAYYTSLLINEVDTKKLIKELSCKPKKELNEIKKTFFRDLFANLNKHDVLPRLLENESITFSSAVSASCYAQLKRHRMATLLSGDYNVEMGNIIPKIFSYTNLWHEFEKLIESTNVCYDKIRKRYGKAAAEYILTNSHKRMVICNMNFREVYHFVKLRSSTHSQWDISSLSDNIAAFLENQYPYMFGLLCGKDIYDEIYKEFYS